MRELVSNSCWVHINLWYKDDITLRLGQIEETMRNIISSLNPYIRRKFYLYEPKPNVFLALEVKEGMLNKVKHWFNEYNQSNTLIFKKRTLTINEKDYLNNSFFLDIMDKVTDYNLYYINETGQYKNKLRSFSTYMAHIIHCMCNQILGTKQLETNLYELILALYGEPYYAKVFKRIQCDSKEERTDAERVIKKTYGKK